MRTYYNYFQASIRLLAPSELLHTITHTERFVDLCLSMHRFLVFPASRENGLFYLSPLPGGHRVHLAH